jgi:hypothetical protein
MVGFCDFGSVFLNIDFLTRFQLFLTNFCSMYSINFEKPSTTKFLEIV